MTGKWRFGYGIEIFLKGSYDIIIMEVMNRE